MLSPFPWLSQIHKWKSLGKNEYVCVDLSEKPFHCMLVLHKCTYLHNSVLVDDTVCLPESLWIIMCGEDGMPVVVHWEILAQGEVVKL